MVKRIELKDFLSYQDVVVDFSGSTIAVIGDNGVGKSAFLEAIPYAYFNVGRETKERLSRIGGDGSHSVDLWDDNGIHISRGRKAGGAGFVEVHKGDELVAKGSEADTWLADYLGMDFTTYMLTAFYGLSGSYSDTLLQVTPSVRLETLQALADVGPYDVFLKRAKEQYKKAEEKKVQAETRIDTLQESIYDEEPLHEGLSAGNKIISEGSEAISELKEERKELQIEEEKYRAFLRERDKIGVERDSLNKELERLNEEKESIESSLEFNKDFVDSATKDLNAVIAKIEKSDEAAIKNRLGGIEEDWHATKNRRDLRKVALDTNPDENPTCPLCGHSISESTISEWQDVIQQSDELLSSLEEEKKGLKSELENIKTYRRKIENLDQQVKSKVQESQKNEEALHRIDRDLKKVSSELHKKDERFIDLSEKLGGGYQGLQSEIDRVGKDLEAWQDTVHEAKQRIAVVQDRLQKNKEARKSIKSQKEARERSRQSMEAYDLLKQAWSRYGVPMWLINRLSDEIEVRATAVYQEFDSGRIEVRSVTDRGKPGVQFLLVDRKGDRTYSQLSKGEQAMFFVAIRVAITQVITERRPVRVETLILDETVANLSPRNRDNLIRLINKSLRKVFPQVMMVSHTALPEIFSETVEVTANDGYSVVV